MPNELIYQELLKFLPKENILIDEPMKKHTTFKIGGNADFYVTTSNIEETQNVVKFARKNNIKLTIIGNGSNILVTDKGIRGITLKVNYNEISKQNTDKGMIYTCGSGTMLSKIANEALQDGMTGFEFAYGIPGSLGGAVYMNAGAYGGEMKDVIIQTTYIDNEGNIHTINYNEHQFGYRKTIFQTIDAVIIESKILLKKCNKDEIKLKMDSNIETRKEKQPLEYPSAGSVFKRGENFIAAKLIDECGLKGICVGDAQVSEKHAGFIINKGNATARDVLDLIDNITKIVKEKTGFEIERELIIIGD